MNATNAMHKEDAANALFQAQRTEQAHAIQTAETAWQRFLSSQSRATAARRYDADRLHAIGAAGREADRQMGYHSPSHL